MFSFWWVLNYLSFNLILLVPFLIFLYGLINILFNYLSISFVLYILDFTLAIILNIIYRFLVFIIILLYTFSYSSFLFPILKCNFLSPKFQCLFNYFAIFIINHYLFNFIFNFIDIKYYYYYYYYATLNYFNHPH